LLAVIAAAVVAGWACGGNSPHDGDGDGSPDTDADGDTDADADADTDADTDADADADTDADADADTDTDTDPCAGVDCGHGECVDNEGSPECVCDEGWAGDFCDGCAEGYTDFGDGCVPSCEGVDCGGHGECDASGDAPVCICDEGYQDNDDDLVCEADCETLCLDCGLHGECDDSSGRALCDCDAGYQDNDFDGECRPTCAAAGLTCGANQACSHASGRATCVCAGGYQDFDHNGTCTATCATAALTCSGHGTCDHTTGTAVCVCLAGYTGADCAQCAAGYQDHDLNGTCTPTCAAAGLSCGAFGACDDSGGTAVCACTDNHAGPDCSSCASGYQDNDGNGTCTATCATAALSCGAQGYCSDASGTAQCLCNTGYQGVGCTDCAYGYLFNGAVCVSDCTSVTCGGLGTCQVVSNTTVCNCASGYQDNDGDLSCQAGCTTAPPVCGANQVCSDASGAVACVCAPGYQDHDLNATCTATCATAALTCSGHGTCSDSGGTAACVCNAGYAGADCAGCGPGYQDNDLNGTCTATCATAALSCGARGSCVDAFGTAQCLCDIGYAGPTCAGCAAGFQDHDGDGVCLPDCQAGHLSCGAHASCDDTSGTPVCVCNPYYQDRDGDFDCAPRCAIACLDCGTGGACDDSSGEARCACTQGYQDKDGDGICLPNCNGVWCGGHGTCSDATGEALCLCNPGYQDHDGDLVCRATCATAGFTCSGHGTCADASGTAVCVCETGYTGIACGQCAVGYQDKDLNGTCLPNCASANLSCGPNRQCEDASGTAACACAPGFQDADDNGTCEPTCATAGLTCSGHGSCSHAGGTPVCVCNAGHAGSTCALCAEGYQDNDGNGTCVANCLTAGLNCGVHGTCSDAGGWAVCVCDTAWTGAACNSCAFGYAWDGLDCVSDCGSVNCGGLGDCVMGDVTACSCYFGYQDNDGDLVCAPDCVTAGLSCQANAACSDISGTAACVCNAGYQDHDLNGTCQPTCAASSLDCGAHGSCSDAGGTAVCVCQTGWAGPDCVDCTAGYQDNDADGTCLPDCGTAGLNCGPWGACDDDLGIAECVCDTGHAGSLCGICDSGYQDYDDNGTCLPTCAASGLDCDQGFCSDSGGTAVCLCTTGFGGTECDECAAGYQDNDFDGVCTPDCAGAGITCAGNGTCDDSSGEALCVCNPGFQDNDGDGTCLLTCNFAALECGEHEHCEDDSGTSTCVCDQGYQDYDGNGTCLVDCTLTDLDCGPFGHCEDRHGRVLCECDEGYGGLFCNFAVDADLAAHFRMDGTVTDSSDNGFLAVGFGTVAYAEDPFGNPSSLALNGTTSVVINAGMQPTLNAIQSGTFAAWVRWDGLSDSETIVDFGSSTVSTGLSRAGSGSGVRFWIGANQIEGGAVGAGQWFHVAATVGPGGMRLYVNAQLQAQGTATTGPMFPSPGTIYVLGRSASGARHMQGRIDDLRLYERALSSFEVASLYATGFWRKRAVNDWDGDGFMNTADNNQLWPNPQQTGGCPQAECTWRVSGCDAPVTDPVTDNVYWYCGGAPVAAVPAQAACEAAGLHLAHIGGALENEVVWLALGDNAWIGAHDLVTESAFQWVTGEPFGWSAWAPGEPNDAFGNEDCVMMTWYSGNWHDRWCEIQAPYVCEYSY
jgi:hypothetical protein